MKTKRIVLPLLLLAIVFVANACDDDQIDGSGQQQTIPYTIADFNSVAAETGFRVSLSPDSLYSVAVTTDDNLLDYVDVSRSSTTLNLKVKPNSDVQFTELRADVRMPSLESLTLASGARCSLKDGFSSLLPFSVVLTAGSSAEGNIVTGNISCLATAGSNLTLEGSGLLGSIVASAGSTVDLRDFTMTDVSVSADAGSIVYINCSGRLDVSASGGSRVYYTGNAQLGSVSVTGGSTLQIIP
ncbi:DUF2807 domain-containing protein [bacterium]|nr:DUF2807 domain-containing protein [bacterium]